MSDAREIAWALNPQEEFDRRERHEDQQRLSILESVVTALEALTVQVLCDGPPDHDAPHFVEIEDETGRSIRVGEWSEASAGYWRLRFTVADLAAAYLAASEDAR